MSFRMKKKQKIYFKHFLFHNVLIKKPEIKKLSNIELLHELPFYDELSITEISKAFRRYARSYKVEIVHHKDPLAQLESSKSSIKDLFKGLSNKMKGFKYQTTVKVLLSKKKKKEKKMETLNILLFILIL